MKKYQFNEKQMDILFSLLDNHLRTIGLKGIYNVLDILKQLNSKIEYDNYLEIELNEVHIYNLNTIFDVNLKTLGITIFKDLSSILSVLENNNENNS